MPTYSARCSECGVAKDYITRIADRDNTPVCCNKQMVKQLSAPAIPAMGLSDHFMVVSPIDGKPIYGRSDYLAHLKKHNVRPESDLKGEAEYRKAQQQAADKATRRETIAKAIAQHGG